MRPASTGPAGPLRTAVVLSAQTDSRFIVQPRYCGPADRANGGYVAGLLARTLQQPFQLTYRRPVPLDTEVHVIRRDNGFHLVHDELVLAEVLPTELTHDVPSPPSHSEAADAQERYAARVRHPFPHCFVCGTRRSPGDGLRLFAGPVEGRELVACTWMPGADVAGNDGHTREEVMFAALDCPGCFASFLYRPPGPAVLGRITAEVLGRPRTGQPCVVYGWAISRDGRKHVVGTAVAGPDGELLGRAQATWVDVQFGDQGPV